MNSTLFDVLFKMFAGNQGVSQTQNKDSKSEKIDSYITNLYPETFYTQAYIENNSTLTRQVQNNISSNGDMIGQVLSIDVLKKIIPMLTQKEKKLNLTDILKTINPQMSEMLGLISSLKSNNKQNELKDKKDNIVDISDYTEVN